MDNSEMVEIEDDSSISPIWSQTSSSNSQKQFHHHQNNSQSQQYYQSQSSSQSQRIYSGLLSTPNFDIVDDMSKIYRDVKISSSDMFQPYTIRDFLSHGPKPRPARGTDIGNNRNKSIPSSSSRQSRTFSSRLREFRSILENKITHYTNWSKLERIPDIISLSTASISVIEEDNLDRCFGWDDDQGIGFKEIEYPIVLIGYIIKKVPVDLEKTYQLCTDIGVIPIPLKSRKDACLFLEDETARIRLSLSRQQFEIMKFSEIVSGVPVALKGTSARGRFWVEDVIFATQAAPEWPIVMSDNAVEMVFVSGLRIGCLSSKSSEPYIDLLVDYLQGLSGSSVEQDRILKPKTRVFFLGNLIGNKHRWNSNVGERMVENDCEVLEKVDRLLDDIAQTMEVFIVPGENDPTHQDELPQPPIHKQIFPEASLRPTFQCLTNPAKINVCISKPVENEKNDDENLMIVNDNYVSLVLTSGLNVRTTMQYCDIECPLEMASKLLEWSHLHPTSVVDYEIAEDIFSLKGSLPHLFVIGGLTDFKVKEWNGVKIIGVPSFAQTGTVMVLTKTGDILPLSFRIKDY